MKYYNSITDKYEDDGQSDFLSNLVPQINNNVPQRDIAQAQPEMNPVVKAYLLNKMKPVESEDAAPQVDQMLDIPQNKSNALDQFSSEKYQQALAQMKEKQSNLGMAQFAAGMGDALARRDSSATDRYFQDAKNNIQDQTVGEFNRQKAGAINDVKTKQQLSQLDPNSQESINFRKLVQDTMPNIAKAYGDKFNMLTAADKDSVLDFGKMREQIDARKEQISLAYQQRRDNKDQQQFEKNQSLQTPFGMANTSDDAKQLKEAFEAKKNFDSKIQEMINLRQKYGGELMNREAVSRGKQLSKDLLLEYKNMAKLGVLSKSDEDIINAIIPSDPLGFSLVPGQDPIMNNLKKFKDDSDKDFNNRVMTRTRNGTKELQEGNPLEQKSNENIDPKIEQFMKMNNISDKNEAIRILKEHGKI